MIIESGNATFFEETFRCKERQRIKSLKRTIDTVKDSDNVDQESDQHENIKENGPSRRKSVRVGTYSVNPNCSFYYLLIK